MNPIQAHIPLIGIPEVRDVNIQIRRRLPEELRVIETTLAQSDMSDDLTGSVRNWYKAFRREFDPVYEPHVAREFLLNRRNVEVVFGVFLQRLAAALLDPLSDFDEPLDDQAFLGVNDRRTYGYKSLCVHLHHTDPQHRNRSPLQPENPEPFTVVPHPIARAMVRWLKQFMPHLRSETIEAAFDALPSIPDLPILPSPPAQNDPARAAAQAYRARRRQLQGQTLEERMQSIINQQPIPVPPLPQIDVQAIVAEIDQHAQERIAEVRQENRRLLESNHQRLRTIQQRDTEQIRAIREEIAQLDADIANREREIESMEQQLNRTDSALSEAKKANLEIRIAIDKLAQEIKKRKKAAKIRKIVGTVVQVCAMIATWYCGGGPGFTPGSGPFKVVIPT